jgi:hypothetical protein
VSRQLQADLATIPDVANVAPRTVVALPPSDADPVWDEMRVMVGGALISRTFDPGEDIITGAPIAFVTAGGDTFVTATGDRFVKVVQ